MLLVLSLPLLLLSLTWSVSGVIVVVEGNRPHGCGSTINPLAIISLGSDREEIMASARCSMAPVSNVLSKQSFKRSVPTDKKRALDTPSRCNLAIVTGLEWVLRRMKRALFVKHMRPCLISLSTNL